MVMGLRPIGIDAPTPLVYRIIKGLGDTEGIAALVSWFYGLNILHLLRATYLDQVHVRPSLKKLLELYGFLNIVFNTLTRHYVSASSMALMFEPPWFDNGLLSTLGASS